MAVKRLLELAILTLFAGACSTMTASGQQCGPFANCTELNRVHPRGVSSNHCAYRPQLDRDKDDWACERN